MHDAVIGEVWASNALSNVASARSDFQKLFSELHAALNQHFTESIARKNDGMLQRGGELNKFVRAGGDLAMLGTPWRADSLANGQTSADIFFQGQGCYEKPRLPGSKSSAPANGSNNIGTNGLDRFGHPKLCFSCGDGNHILPCPDERRYPQAAANRIAQDPTKVKLFFLEFIDQVTDMETRINPGITCYMSQTEQRDDADKDLHLLEDIAEAELECKREDFSQYHAFVESVRDQYSLGLANQSIEDELDPEDF
jgi:hypothetical protein